jgi:hypothetical protein
MRLPRITPSALPGLLGFVGFLFFTNGIGTAHADTRFVASNGVDGPSCGTAAAPCRSITQAITLAGAGGRVIVGPGQYGDLDGDGVLGEPGEEPAPGPCNCMILIAQRVTLESVGGAGATVLDVPPTVSFGVRVQADDVVFGKKSRGFTTSGGFTVMQVDLGFARASIAGNRITGGGSTGLSMGGSDHAIVGNSAVGNGGAGFVLGGVASTGFKISKNFAAENGQQGLNIRGGGFKVSGNVASNNRGTGISVFYDAFDPTASVTGNVAAGNGDKGFILGTGAIFPVTPTARRNAAVGNRRGGIFMAGNGVQVEDSNIFGNGSLPDVAGAGGLLNCGIISGLPTPVVAEGNFWGASTGPGADPADAVCVKGAGSVDAVPFATAAFNVKSGAGK